MSKVLYMKNYFSLITFSHSVFALPFAFVGYFLAMQQTHIDFDVRIFLFIVLCMLFARSAAMAFNRYLDRDIDAQNPRTATREIPAGIISPQRVLFFVILNCVLFIVSAALINEMCLLLSPIALIIVLGYSYTKRFTYLCHFILGLGLSLAPIGAYIAAADRFNGTACIYSAIVLLWVSGFDIIYALQDDEFDSQHDLFSVPVRFGRTNALRISNALHLLCAALMVFVTWHLYNEHSNFYWLHIIGATIFLAMLFYQHTLISENNLTKVNRAFFTTNGIASVIYGSFFVLDYFF